MSKIKILYLTVRADHGGGPRHVDLLINNISSGFSLFVACPDDKPYFQLWKYNKAVQNIYLLPHRKFSISHLTGLSKFIKENEISIVHSHGKGAGVYARLLKLADSKLKVVHTFHGVHTQEYGFLAKALYYLYERTMKKLTDKFINVSFGEYNICLMHGLLDSKRQITIYNGVPDLNRHPEKPKQLPTEKFRIISISRFDFQKNMQLSYEIAKQLRNNSKIEFVWVGDGADKAILEAKAKADGLTNIVFTGFADQPEKYIETSHLYLSTSRWEGLPLALIEAASLSLPIVSTNVTGNNEVVKDGYNGYLFEEISPEIAANHIIELYTNPELYLKLSSNSRKTYLKNFTVVDMIRQTEKVYQK